MRKLILALATVVALARAEESWLRFTTPRFEVLTDAGAGRGREVLLRLDEIRQVLEKMLAAKPRAQPLRVFVFRSEKEFEAFKDPRRKTMAAFYQSGPDRDYIAMQYTAVDAYRIVFHEYTHFAVAHPGTRLPLWLNEGIAEFFSTVSMSDSRMQVGAPIPAHIATLREQKWIGLPELMSIDQSSPDYNEQGKVGIFYAESCAFVHMLHLSHPYGAKRKRFLDLVVAGTAPAQALEQSFGESAEQVVRDLRDYIGGNTLPAAVIQIEPPASTGRLEPELVDATEAGIALADLLIHVGKTEQASERLQRLGREKPKSAAVEEELGDAALAANRKAEALAHYQTAIRSGTRNARIYFEKANLMRDLEGEADSITRQIIPDLERAIELNPRYWQARHLLGYLYFRDGRYRDAVEQLAAAADLESRNVNIWETLALAQLYAGDREKAAASARRGRALATKPQEIASLHATMRRIKARDRPPDARGEISERVPAGWRNRQGNHRISGQLVQLDCSGARARFHVLVGERRMLFDVDDPAKIVLTNAPGASVELQCGRFAPRAVTVEYVVKPDPERNTEGEITALEFR